MFRFAYQSLVTPPSVFDYDMDARHARLLKQQPVLGGYDRAALRDRAASFATAPDGVRVPISLVYRKGLRKDGTAPRFTSTATARTASRWRPASPPTA